MLLAFYSRKEIMKMRTERSRQNLQRGRPISLHKWESCLIAFLSLSHFLHSFLSFFFLHLQPISTILFFFPMIINTNLEKDKVTTALSLSLSIVPCVSKFLPLGRVLSKFWSFVFFSYVSLVSCSCRLVGFVPSFLVVCHAFFSTKLWKHVTTIMIILSFCLVLW